MFIGIAGLTIEKKSPWWRAPYRGSAGAGKDEAATVLLTEYGFQKLSFADPLKRICNDVYEFTDRQLWGSSECRNAIDGRYGELTPRKALQTLGDDWGRQNYADTWIEYALRVSAKLAKGGWGYSSKWGLMLNERAKPTHLVCTDLRYPNELAAIHKMGGITIRCKRLVDELKVRPTHRSEIALLKVPDSAFTYVVENGSDIKGLHSKIRAIAEVLKPL